MKNSIVGIIVAVIVIGVVIGVIFYQIKRREESFEGEVIDKNIVENANNTPMNNGMNRPGIRIGNYNNGVTHSYHIKVRTDNGKEVPYTISSGMYEVIKIGDRVRKPKGTTEVTILSTNQGSNQPQSTPATSVQPAQAAAQPPAPPSNNNQNNGGIPPQTFA